MIRTAVIVILAAALVAVAALPASAQIAACPTILSSLHADWRATQGLFDRYGSGMEANPIVRAIGPDLYFAAWTVGVMATCKESRWWRVASIVVWAVQTWAVSTHERTGTVRGYPLLMFEVRF